MWWYYIFFYRNTSVITRYGFRYNFIKIFGVADIFRYPILITQKQIVEDEVDLGGGWKGQLVRHYTDISSNGEGAKIFAKELVGSSLVIHPWQVVFEVNKDSIPNVEGMVVSALVDF